MREVGASEEVYEDLRLERGVDLIVGGRAFETEVAVVATSPPLRYHPRSSLNMSLYFKKGLIKEWIKKDIHASNNQTMRNNTSKQYKQYVDKVYSK